MSIPSSRPTWLGVWDENISWEIARTIFPTIHGRSDCQLVNPSPSHQGASDIIAPRIVPTATKKLANDVLQRMHVWHNLISNRKVLYQCRQSPEYLSVSVGSVREVPASRANTTFQAPLLLRSKCNINQCRAVKGVSPMLYLSKWLYELLLVQTSAQQLGSTTVDSKYTWIQNTRNGHLGTHMHNANWKTWSHVLLYLSSI